MQRLEEYRWYKLICTQLKDPPAPERVFPLLATTTEDDDGNLDAEDNYQQIAASLGVGE